MKYVIWTGLGLLVAWLSYQLGLLDVIIIFLIAGALPGTNILLPPVAMFIFLALMLLLTAYWMQRQHFAVQIRTMKAKHDLVVRRPIMTDQVARRYTRQMFRRWTAIILVNIRLRTALLGVPGRFSKRWVVRTVIRRYDRTRKQLAYLGKWYDTFGPKL